jgi:hypothetical protein
MPRKGMLQRVAVIGIGGVAVGLAVLTNTAGIASAKPNICSFAECMPDVPPDTPNHPGPTPMPPYQGSHPDPGVFDSPGYFPCPPRTVCLG